MDMMCPPLRRLVVIGNGMAGMRTVEEILVRLPGHFRITVFGAEPQPNYNRIMLSPLLAGEARFDDIVLNSLGWYAEHQINLIAGEAVVAIDRQNRVVHGALGTAVPYDVLLIATGSNPFMLPLPGGKRPGVMTFRSAEDVDAMLGRAAPGKRAVVIGGGLLGLEAAHGLNRRGLRVSVVHLMPTLMERQLDQVAAQLLAAALTARGIDVYTSANTARFDGATADGPVTSVALADGRVIPADLVVMAVGIRPNCDLAKAAGLPCNRGILVDATLRTSDPAVFAVGECIELNQTCFGLVAPIWDMAKIAADEMCGIATSGFTPKASGTRLKVSGIEMFSAGEFSGDDTTEDLILRDAARGRYRRLVLRDDRLAGIVCFGETTDAAWYFELLHQARSIAAIRDTLIFGPQSGAPALEPAP